MNCLELNFITPVVLRYIFLCTEYITHERRIFYLDNIFYLSISFSTSMLHFLFWRGIFYLDDIFYLDVAFSTFIAFST